MNRPLFHADWLDAVFLHFRLSAVILQPFVPLELDTSKGDAYVSLVAFTQSRLRPTIGGRFAAMLSKPLARHAFFNVRTYVRTRDARGIFFIAEGIPNRLAVLIGPRMYGLPYRLGRLSYRYDRSHATLAGRVDDVGSAFEYRATPRVHEAGFALEGSLDHFLLERYTAFTHRQGVTRRFDVAHSPWPQLRLAATIVNDTLLKRHCPWFDAARLVAANYSPGVRDVGISPPMSYSPICSCGRPTHSETSDQPIAACTMPLAGQAGVSYPLIVTQPSASGQCGST